MKVIEFSIDLTRIQRAVADAIRSALGNHVGPMDVDEIKAVRTLINIHDACNSLRPVIESMGDHK